MEFWLVFTKILQGFYNTVTNYNIKMNKTSWTHSKNAFILFRLIQEQVDENQRLSAMNHHVDLARVSFNPNSIGVKSSLKVLGVVIYIMALFWPPYWAKNVFFKFWIETLGICHDWDSIKQGFFFIKAVLLYEHGRFFQKKSKIVFFNVMQVISRPAIHFELCSIYCKIYNLML